MTAEEAVFSDLIDEHLPMWRQVACRILGNAADADDAVQQALLCAWEKRGGFRSDARMSSWIYRIVVNRSYDLLRRKLRESGHRRRLVEQADLLPGGGGENSEEMEKLNLAIGRLPELYRQTVMVNLAAGMDTEKTAKLLGCNTGTLYWRMHKAKKLLSELLREPGTA